LLTSGHVVKPPSPAPVADTNRPFDSRRGRVHPPSEPPHPPRTLFRALRAAVRYGVTGRSARHGEFEPDGLADVVAAGPGAPAAGGGGDELEAASVLVLGAGDALVRGVGEGVGHFHPQDAGQSARAHQADPDGAGGVAQGVGHEFADQQRGEIADAVEAPAVELGPDGGAGATDGARLGGEGPRGTVALDVDHTAHFPAIASNLTRLRQISGTYPI